MGGVTRLLVVSGRRVAASLRLVVRGGAFTARLPVPASLLPGVYSFAAGSVAGSVPFSVVSSVRVRLASPATGVVDSAWLTPTRHAHRGDSRYPGPVRVLWAYFHFAALPRRGAHIRVRWQTPAGSATFSERSVSVIESLVRSSPLPTGRYRVSLLVNGVVVRVASVRIV